MKEKIRILGEYSVLMNDFYNQVIQNNDLRALVNESLKAKCHERKDI